MTQSTAMVPSNPPAPAPKGGLSTSYAVIALVLVVGLVGVLAGVGIAAAKIAANTIGAELKSMRQDNAEFAAHNEKRMRDLISTVQEIEINTPPTNDKLFTILSKGIGVTEDVIRTGQVGTTPIAAFATDLTAGQATDAYTQEIVIQNRDDVSPAVNNLCFRTIAFALPTTCNTTCSTSGFTCPAVGGAGASTDGVVTAKGVSWQRRYDGTNCVCLVASAAGMDYQTERVIR